MPKMGLWPFFVTRSHTMKRTCLLIGLSVFALTMWGVLGHMMTNGAEQPAPPVEKKVLLRVPLGTGEVLTISAIIHEEITEIELTPVVQGNKVIGANIKSLDTEHKITAQGQTLMLDIPNGRVAVGGTFSIDSKDGRSLFAVKVEDPKALAAAAAAAQQPPPAEPEPKPKPGNPPPDDKEATDAAIQEILKPEGGDEEKKDE
jgi:hypothetical protein